MKFDLTLGGVLGIGVLALLAIFGVYAYTQRDKLAQAANLVNPASSENVVNRAITSGVSAATGREETLGGWLADIFGPKTDYGKGSVYVIPKNPLPRGTGYDSGGGPAYG